MAERNNDLGKQRLNETNITIDVDWNAEPVVITKLELDSSIQQRMKDTLDGREAKIYLDVTGGYLRQRFDCGPVSGLPNMIPACTESKSNEIKKGMPTNAKFEINVVFEDNAVLMRRSPKFRTFEGDEVDLFFFQIDDSLGEIPWKITPPDINSSDSQTTINISSKIFHEMMRVKDNNNGVEWMMFIDAFRTTFGTIAMAILDEESAINSDGFAPIIQWAESVLKIAPPGDSDFSTLIDWKNECADKAFSYYKLSTKVRNGLAVIIGGDE